MTTETATTHQSREKEKKEEKKKEEHKTAHPTRSFGTDKKETHTQHAVDFCW
jgi:hypothetical protein